MSRVTIVYLLLGCGAVSSPKVPDFIAAKTFAGVVSLAGLDGRGGTGGTGGGEDTGPKLGLKPVTSFTVPLVADQNSDTTKTYSAAKH